MLAAAIAVVLLAAGLAAVLLYNRLVKLRTFTEEGWAQVGVQLTRRADLIPNLVTTVSGYATHEAELFATVAQLRAASVAGAEDTPEERGKVEAQLSGALAQVLAVAENYPDLKASQNFLALQTELAGTEDRIAAARRMFNANVRDYNTACSTLPSNLVARVGGFTPAQFFQADDAARALPPVQPGR